MTVRELLSQYLGRTVVVAIAPDLDEEWDRISGPLILYDNHTNSFTVYVELILR